MGNEFVRQGLLVLVASHTGNLCLMIMTGLLMRKLAPVPGSATDEYTLYNNLRDAITQAMIPLLGLQTLFAQMAAKQSLANIQESLSGAVRSVLGISLGVWTIVGVGAWIARDWIRAEYGVQGGSVLVLMAIAGWAMAAAPLFLGLLQGRQRFGAMMIGKATYDFSLLIGVAAGLHFWKPTAHAAMAGLCAGALLGCAAAAWISRGLWTGESVPFNLRRFARGLIPITIALGVTQFMVSEDSLVARRFFSEGLADYNAGRRVGIMAYFLILPVTVVLFPKVVAGLTHAGGPSPLKQALGAAFVVGVGAATGLTFFPKLPLWVLSNEVFLSAAPYVTKFAWAFAPLSLFTILVNNLLARERYQAIPWLAGIAVAYSLCIRIYHPTLDHLILMLGVFASLLMVTAAWFSREASGKVDAGGGLPHSLPR